LVALLIGGKIWGIAGMILAIPATEFKNRASLLFPVKASCHPDRRQGKNPMLNKGGYLKKLRKESSKG